MSSDFFGVWVEFRFFVLEGLGSGDDDELKSRWTRRFLGGDLDFDLDLLCRRCSRLGEGFLAVLSSSDDTTRLVTDGDRDRDCPLLLSSLLATVFFLDGLGDLLSGDGEPDPSLLSRLLGDASARFLGGGEASL